MPLCRTLSLALLVIVVHSVHVLFAATIVNDPFSDGGYSAGADPQDVEWIPRQGASLQILTDNGAPGIGSGNALAHNQFADGNTLAASFPTQTLAVGQTIRLSGDFRLLTTNSGTEGIRLGLYHDGGTPVAGSQHFDESNDDFGYQATLATGAAVPTTRIQKETGVSPNSAGLSSGLDRAVFPSPGVLNGAINDLDPHSFTFDVTRAATNQMDFDFSVYSLPGGMGSLIGHATASDNGTILVDGFSHPIFFQFNEIAIGRGFVGNDSSFYPWRIDNINVSSSLVSVPEPGGMAVAGVGTCVSFLCWLLFGRQRISRN